MKTLALASTAFQKVTVRGDGRQTEFQVRGAVHAWRHEERYLAMAWGAMAAAALLRPGGPPRSVLMLGLAGGTVFRILRHLLPGARLTAVEIDAGIVELARQHMRIDELGIDIHIADAVDWLARNRRRFDVVIDDCYLAGEKDVFRPNALDARVMADLERAVAPGGVLSVNLVTGCGHRRVQSAYRRWFRGRFPVVRSLTVPDSQNEILAGGEALGSGAALGAWLEKFSHPLDVRRWRQIMVRRL